MSQEVDTISMPDGEEDVDLRFNPQHDANEFLRETLIMLAKSEITPADIFSSTFSDVKKEDNEYLVVNTQVDIHITASIGHDRVEEYWDKETYKENGVQKVRDVKKTRTVTDWTPFACDHKGKSVAIVRNDEFDSNDGWTDRQMLCAVSETPRDKIETVPANIVPNGTAVRRARSLCGEKCAKKSLPGDKQKDRHYSGDVTVERTTGIIMPDYSLSYTYQGKEYKSFAHACGKLDIDCIYPTDISSTKSLVKKKTMPLLISALCCFGLGLIIGMFIPLVMLLWFLGFALLLTFFVMRAKLTRKINADKQKFKLNALNEELKKRGLNPYN